MKARLQTKGCSVSDIIWVVGKATERSLSTQSHYVAAAYGYHAKEAEESLSTWSKNPPIQCHAGYARVSAADRGQDRVLMLDSHE